jgi:hypothetical protein
MRMLLCLALADDGYRVTEVPAYLAALGHLRAAAEPMVLVSGNCQMDHHAEGEFFGHLMAEPELAQRHRFVLLSTIPELLSDDVDATLRAMDVTVVPLPCRIPDLLVTVAQVAERTWTEDASAG